MKRKDDEGDKNKPATKKKSHMGWVKRTVEKEESHKEEQDRQKSVRAQKLQDMLLQEQEAHMAKMGILGPLRPGMGLSRPSLTSHLLPQALSPMMPRAPGVLPQQLAVQQAMSSQQGMTPQPSEPRWQSFAMGSGIELVDTASQMSSRLNASMAVAAAKMGAQGFPQPMIAAASSNPKASQPTPSPLLANMALGRKRPPTLPRTKVSGDLLSGHVEFWKGKFGWIRPDKPLVHPAAEKHQGKVYLSGSDVFGGDPVPGSKVQFQLYEDTDGLGAEECIVF